MTPSELFWQIRTDMYGLVYAFFGLLLKSIK